jgi:hypothetical protein
MNDEANPQGMPRPRLATKKVYQDDPKTSRPMLGVRKRNAGAGVDIRGNAWGDMSTGRSRPMIPVAGEGNSPTGIQRPILKLKAQDNPQKPGKPYDQAMDPDYY